MRTYTVTSWSIDSGKPYGDWRPEDRTIPDATNQVKAIDSYDAALKVAKDYMPSMKKLDGMVRPGDHPGMFFKSAPLEMIFEVDAGVSR